jgi:hypothetical protein
MATSGATPIANQLRIAEEQNTNRKRPADVFLTICLEQGGEKGNCRPEQTGINTAKPLYDNWNAGAEHGS